MKLELVLDEVELPWVPHPDWMSQVEGMLSDSGGAEATLQVVLTNDPTLQQHNLEYRSKDEATDVLSFSYLADHEDEADQLASGNASALDFADEPLLEGEDFVAGQVLISVETVCRRGATHAAELQGEFAFMIGHGLLHVLGFEHHDEEEALRMRGHEQRLMERAGFELRPEYVREGGMRS